MAIVNDIYAFLNEIAPVRYQMDFDNAGFLVGDGGTAVKKTLLALDVTDDVIAEAVELRAQLIVSHHPLIFTPLRHATTDDLAGRKVLVLARHGVSAICMHTNLDIADGGVNDALMAALDAEVTGGLEPAGTAADGSALTCGRIGKLKGPMTMAEFLPYVAGRLHAVRASSLRSRTIRRLHPFQQLHFFRQLRISAKPLRSTAEVKAAHAAPKVAAAAHIIALGLI